MVTPADARLMPEKHHEFEKDGKLFAITVLPDQKLGPRCFILTLEDDSMVPQSPFERERFYKGDRVLIDPDREIAPGDFVCAEMEGSSECIFRQYRAADKRSGADYLLIPLNLNYPTEDVGPNNPGRIVGRLIRQIRDY